MPRDSHSPPSLPDRVFRKEVAVRSVGPMAVVGAGGCAFITKPDAGHDYVQRVLPRYTAVCVLRGSGVHIDSGGQRHAVSAGAVIQLPPDKMHSVHHDADGQWAEFWFSLDRAVYHALLSARLISDAPVLWPGLSRTRVEHFEMLLQLISKGADEDAGRALLVTQELLFEIHRAAMGRERAQPHAQAIDHARAALERDIKQLVDLEDLAEVAGMSYERFRKVFRDRVGVSPGSYRIQCRLDAAKGMLMRDGKSVKEIAYLLGYPDPFSFSKQFKKHVGMSPSAYQRQW